MSVFRDSPFWNSDHGPGHGREYVPMTVREGRTQPYYRSLAIRLLPSLLIFGFGIIIGSNHPLYLSIYSRRPLSPSSILPPALPPAPPVSSTSSLAYLPDPKEDIPNLVHYVYGLSDEPDQPDFPYFAYLAIRSSLLTLQPDEVWFHCIHEPHGYWWDRIKYYEGYMDPSTGQVKGLVKVRRARDVQWIGKDKKPVTHFAHKADIIRLEVLRDYGGIYLDIDTFVLRPFATHGLMRQDVVLGMEAHGLTYLRGIGGDEEMNPKGLCNAVIVARKGAEFIDRWLTSYEGFRGDKWTEHSVEMPWTLAKMYPTLLTILSERAFFWPLWTDDHIHAVYETTEYDFELSGQLAYHAWESKARPYLSALDPTTIHQIDTSFTRMARRFVEPDEERRWKAAGAKDGAGETGLDKGDEEVEWEEVQGAGGGNRRGGVRWSRETT
ncbi:uncharacterized protein I303_104290 [Kwoniella dejecticola CBS 10117]|uniref:Glycosyl transferase n=1 Tax=Kwoniella dejecticola CBS 10117 TaxID=1296121 RepID=A0A1A6A5S1_9TREE|nr:uncharacterized protein I303_04734 [Kwoniella dejecticola CBS 10117]OBR85399.1 hypothetical protein I303_04734 [Kwoniella dejecticola CBS 10117]